MDGLLNSFASWVGLGTALFAALLFFVRRVEVDYRRELQGPAFRWRELMLIAIPGWILAFVICWVSREKLPFACFLPIFGAAAVLVGIWRVDVAFLLIPDRFQIVGSLLGLSHVVILARSGEESLPLLADIAIGLALVGLMWLLSSIYYCLRGAIGFGFGDVKLLAWVALFVGRRMVDVIFVSTLVGISFLICVIVYKSVRNRKLILPGGRDGFAFGPAIICGFIIEGILRYA